MIPVEWIPGLLLADLLAVTAWLTLVAARQAWQVDGPPPGPEAAVLPWRDRSAEWAFLRRPPVDPAARPPSDLWLAVVCHGACEPYHLPYQPPVLQPPVPARLELPLTARCRWPSPVPVTHEMEALHA